MRNVKQHVIVPLKSVVTPMASSCFVSCIEW